METLKEVAEKGRETVGLGVALTFRNLKTSAVVASLPTSKGHVNKSLKYGPP